MHLDNQLFNFNLIKTGENIIRCSQVDEAFFNVFNITLNENTCLIKPVEKYVDGHPIIKVDVEFSGITYKDVEFKVIAESNAPSQVFINEYALMHGIAMEFKSQILLHEQAAEVDDIIEQYDWDVLEEESKTNKESKIVELLTQIEKQLLHRIDESIDAARQSIVASALGIHNKAENTINKKINDGVDEFTSLFEQWKQATEIKVNKHTIDVLKKACKHLEDQFEIVVQEQESSSFSHLSEKIFAASIEAKDALHIELSNKVLELSESLQSTIKDADDSLRLHVEQQLKQFNDDIVAESIKNFDDGIAAFFNKQTLWLQEATTKQINEINEAAAMRIDEACRTVDGAIENLHGKHGELAQQLKEHAQQTLEQSIEQAAEKITTEQIKSVRECVDEVLAEQMQALEAKASDESIISEARAAQANVFKNALGAIKTEMSNEVKSHVANLQTDLYKKFTVYSQAYAGGGTVAMQFADGGTMNGNLNVLGQILSGGVDISTMFGGGGTSSWGSITGTLSSQTDLQTALNNKLATNGNGSALTGISLTTGVTGTLPVANGGTGATTLSANAVLLGNGTSPLQTVSPSTSGNVLTSNGTTWTSTAPTNNPAGTGSELQFRSSATTFGRVQNSSVVGPAITLGVANGTGLTSENFLVLRTTSAATSALQQVSPSIALEGRGFATTSGTSQIVRFRQNILPVLGTTNPSVTWRLQSEINNSGTWTDRLLVDSASLLTAGRWSVGANGNGWTFRVDGNVIFGVRGSTGANMHPSYSWGWSSNAGDLGEPQSLALWQDAANILAQRNGLLPQTSRLYNTFTSATTGENLQMQWASNEARIGTSVGSGGGVQRPLVFGSWDSSGTWSPAINIATTGTVAIASLSSNGIVTVTSGNGTLTTSNAFSQFRLVDNFIGIIQAQARSIGTGATVSTGIGLIVNRPAAWLQTGTTATGYSQLIERSSGSPAAWVSGASSLDFSWAMLVGNLSDGTETYTVRAGLETNNFGSVNDGVFFRYTHSVNSGNWICVTRRSGVETVTNTSTAPTTASYTKFQILINSAGTSVQFLIDGVVVATHTTNIPTSAGYSIGIIKSLGTTTRLLYVSPFQYIQTLNTPY